MSAFLRRASTRQLLLVVAAAIALAVGGAAIAVAATENTATPPPSGLASALHAALAGAPAVQGLSADVSFTDDLISGSSIEGTDPLLTGATGRLWVAAGGRFRLELQSGNGDVEIVAAAGRLTVSDPTSHTVYELALPARSGGGRADAGIPTVAAIQGLLDRVGAHATISAAVPANVGGREAYTVTLSPKQGGGLVAALALAFDAANATPLRIALYARGESSPVLALELSDVAYGPVDAGVFAIPPPAGSRIVDLAPPAAGAGAGSSPPVTGAGAVAAQLSFPLSAPATLAGLPLGGVRLVEVSGHDGALATYGSGLGAIAVLESPAGAATAQVPGGEAAGMLPTVSVGGASGHELATPLGTIITFARGGVSYAVAGSVGESTALAAARGL